MAGLLLTSFQRREADTKERLRSQDVVGRSGGIASPDESVPDKKLAESSGHYDEQVE
jgi:hypothetical protein